MTVAAAAGRPGRGADGARARDARDVPAHAGGFRRLNARGLRLADDFTTGPGTWDRVRFAVGQVALGRGTGEAASVHAWTRRVRWARQRRQLGLAGALRWLVTSPARAVLDTREAVRRYGPACASEFGVSVAAQWRQLLWLRLTHGIQRNSYYHFQLFRPERRRMAALYLQQDEATFLYRVLAYRDARDDYLLLEDKRRFERWCREHDLPTVRTVAEFVDGRVAAVAFGEGDGDALAGRDLFSKPVDARGGKGARRWRWADGAWRDEQGAPHDRAALFAALAAESRGGATLLQELLLNVPEFAPLASSALSTARVVTARPPGGRAEVIVAALRLGVDGSATDNLTGGGIAVAVNVETGRLETGIRPDPRTMIRPLTRHPDTGFDFASFAVPRWGEVKALALRAHDLMRQIAVVGWDVAVTPQGPLLVEGNFTPEARLSQALTGLPLGRTNHLRYLDAHLRRSYARGAGHRASR